MPSSMSGKKRKSLSSALGEQPTAKKARIPPPARVAQGFIALPFLLGDVRHHVFAKEQAASEDEDWPVGRSLFLASLPVGSSREDIATALSGLTSEEVESVRFVGAGQSDEISRSTLLDVEGLHEADEQPSVVPPLFTSPDADADLAAQRPPHSAVVIFETAAGVSAVLKARPAQPLAWPEAALPSFADLHQRVRPPLTAVKQHTDAWMAAFEKREAIAAALPVKEADKSTADDDEDGDGGGWTLVKRGGTHGRSLLPTEGVADPRMATGLSSVGVASRSFERTAKHGLVDEDLLKKAEKKRKRQEHIREGLYRFERDERRRKNLADLRSKFEADKAKVEERRQARKFNPY